MDGGRTGGLVALVVWGLVVALLAVTLAGRTVSAPPAWLAALVVLLPYLYGGVVLVASAAWTGLPDRRSLPLAIAAVIGAALASWGASAGHAVDEGLPLRVMSWNVRRLWGEPGAEGRADDCVVDAIRATSPDALVLLEVSRDDTTRLSDRLGLSCAHAPYQASDDPGVGGLAACAAGSRWSLVSGAGQRFVDDEDWNYVLAEISARGVVVNLLAVHLYPYRLGTRLRRGHLGDLPAVGEAIARGQSDQAAALLERTSKLADPTIVAGDFNSTRDSALHAGLRRHLHDTWRRGGDGFGSTVDAFGWLPLRVDYVYASAPFQVGRDVVPDVPCSDHRPVVSDLSLPAVALSPP